MISIDFSRHWRMEKALGFRDLQTFGIFSRLLLLFGLRNAIAIGAADSNKLVTFAGSAGSA